MSNRNGPVLIELDDEASLNPADAEPMHEHAVGLGSGQAMQVVAVLGARRPSRLSRLFLAASLSLIGLLLSLAAWNFVTNLLIANPILGGIVTGLIGIVTLTLLLICLREFAAFSRLSKLDHLHRDAEAALVAEDLPEARAVAMRIAALYRNRPELRDASRNVSHRAEEAFDAVSVFALVETQLLTPLDAAAQRQIETAARQVATATALIPLALVDVVSALTANLRMIRQIAEIYGGRAGFLGSWRLTRAVMTHLVATGAVAIGDDLIGSALGGSVVSKISRRFGEGVVNGALTARVGVAAMEVCRPLAFSTDRRPSVTGLVRNALSGLFS